MRIESFESSRKAKSEKSLSRPDRRSISYRGRHRRLEPRSADNMHAHLLRDKKTSTALSNRDAMLLIPGGSFRMGSNDFYREVFFNDTATTEIYTLSSH